MVLVIRPYFFYNKDEGIMKEVIEKLIRNNQTISTMESCTGGMLANEITNIKNASKVFKFGAVTYSNEFKIKMNVSSKTIDKYTVYSQEVAKEMSLAITRYTNSDYGIGITGKLMVPDPNNIEGENNLVFYAIYEKTSDSYYLGKVVVTSNDRTISKMQVIDEILKDLKVIIK